MSFFEYFLVALIVFLFGWVGMDMYNHVGCPLEVGDRVRQGTVAGIDQVGSATKNCTVHIRDHDGEFIRDFAFKFEKVSGDI